MFFHSRCAFLSVALAAYTATVSARASISATPSLTVKISTPNVNVVGLKNLKVTATITNTGRNTLKLLNEPRGVLSTFPDYSFTINNATGSSPSFKGARAKYSPTYAAGLDDPSVFTVLGPGNSINVTHDLSVAYDFTQSGAGDYSIRPSNSFIYVDGNGTPQDLYATIKGIAKVKLSGDLAVSGPVHIRRAPFTGCSAYQQRKIMVAATAANDYAADALAHIQGMSASTRRYKTWFGAYNAANKAIVQSHFEKVSGDDISKYFYDCSCTSRDINAYVYTGIHGVVHICRPFWKARTTGKNSKAGILVHEATHFEVNGGTRDFRSGQLACKELAKRYPASAVMNAPSHQYFVEKRSRLFFT